MVIIIAMLVLGQILSPVAQGSKIDLHRSTVLLLGFLERRASAHKVLGCPNCLQFCWTMFTNSCSVLADDDSCQNRSGLMNEGLNRRSSIASALKNCSSLVEGRRIHAHVIKYRLQGDTFLCNLLIRMYCKCGSVDDARLVFNNMDWRTVVSWNSMIATYSQHGRAREALQLYLQMQQLGMELNRFSFINAIRACSSLLALEEGKAIHSRIVQSGWESDIVVGTALLNLYVKCDTLNNARGVFDNMRQRDVIAWTAMIVAYTQHGLAEEAVTLFWQMKREGVKPDHVCFISILGACGYPAALVEGRAFHAGAVDNGFESDGVLGTALVSFYHKCGALDDARSVFNQMHQQDVVSWTTMIMVYAEHGFGKEARDLFCQMQHQGFKPNGITFISVLSSCASPHVLPEGKAIHASIVHSEFESDAAVNDALVNMYSKCRALELARLVFNDVTQFDSVSWNTMIAAYSQHRQRRMVFELFSQMKQQGIEPDQIALSSVLGVCGSPADLAEGKAIHASIVAGRFKSNIVVGNALINMYNKCGAMEDACAIFEHMHNRDVVSWNAMISSNSQHGNGKEALQVFKKMQEDGVEPDEATFSCLLSACSHSGLLDEAHCLFVSMMKAHHIMPSLEHYCCMVDILGRAGHLQDAEDMIKEMPCEPDFVVWMTLLGACRMHNDAERGQRAACHVFNLNAEYAETYVLLSNICAANGRDV